MTGVWELKETQSCLNKRLSVVATSLYSVVCVKEQKKVKEVQSERNFGKEEMMTQSIEKIWSVLDRLSKLEGKYPKEMLKLYGSINELRNKSFELNQQVILKTSSMNERRVYDAVVEKKLNDCTLIRVQDGYYDRSLKERADELSALGVNNLCKSLLYRNESYSPKAAKTHYSGFRYILILIQYTHKLDDQRLSKLLGSKLRFATEEESSEVSGYEFNAVPPIGLKKQNECKIIVCKSLLNLCPPEIFAGGGEVNTKLRINDVYKFNMAMNADVFDVSFPRDDDDKEI